ncbi:hypothetical protein [Corynebacterium sp. NML130628]|nr:hypothetical protein [Corynebacterium sp. NML130628]
MVDIDMLENQHNHNGHAHAVWALTTPFPASSTPDADHWHTPP